MKLWTYIFVNDVATPLVKGYVKKLAIASSEKGHKGFTPPS